MSGMYDAITRVAENIVSDTLFHGHKCKDCQFRQGLDSDGLFECVVPNTIQCPYVVKEVDDVITQLEVALREKTL